MAKRNLVLHCYKPAVNTDKVYLCCIRETTDLNSGAIEWVVLTKWGRRGNKLSNLEKGRFDTENKAEKCQVSLYTDRLKEGYLDIEGIQYAKHIAQFGTISALTLNSAGIQENLEKEVGVTSTGSVLKKVVWQCERCGKDYEPELDHHGLPTKRNAFCPNCIEIAKEAGRKASKRIAGEDEVLVCVDNSGLEDRFDVGIEYLVEDHNDKTMVYVFDKMGRKDEYFKVRFMTSEQWDKKNGKIRVNIIKNRESDPAKPVFMPLAPGQTVKVRAIPPTAARMPTRSHFAGV